MSVKTIKDVDLKNKTVFVRVDFNVPFDGDGQISDTTRIIGALPTIKYLVEQNCKVVLASHLGRPKGQFNMKFTLAPVAKELSTQLNMPVTFVGDCKGEEVKKACAAMNGGEIVLLENARFYAEEEKNDADFAKQIIADTNAEVFVNDAFGTAHRAHATTAGVSAFVKTSVAGFLIERELEYLGSKTQAPERPFAVILGGAKVSDKITVIDSLLDKCDIMLVGGAMAYTFDLANNRKVGDSLTEPDKVDLALAAMQKAKDKGVKLLLPTDHLVSKEIDFAGKTLGETQVQGEIEDTWSGVDIGPKAIAEFTEALKGVKTILWNGPMGVFEIEESSKGTFAIAKIVAESDAISIIGGGDSVKAIKKSGYSNKVSFISTGGGASLEFLEGKVLPGVACLENA